MANLGFIGLGAMGGNIAARLLDSGHQVTGYNRTRAKAQWLVDRGMKWANSPRDVATAAAVIFTMVTNGEALTSVAAGDSGLLAGLSSGKYCVDMSTVGPDVSRRLASNVRERGADMIDAPVSGSVLTLQQGKLSIMVGGRQETFETLKPVLQDIGPKVTYVGANGLALALKIALNLQLAKCLHSRKVCYWRRRVVSREIQLLTSCFTAQLHHPCFNIVDLSSSNNPSRRGSTST